MSIMNSYIEKRLDEIVLNDIVLTDKKVERKVRFIKNCHNGRWVSISLTGGESLEQLLGHNHQIALVKNQLNK